MATVTPFAGIRFDPARAGDPGGLLADAAEWRPLARRPGQEGRPAPGGSIPAAPDDAPVGRGDGRPHAARLFSDWAGTLAGDWLSRGVLVRDEPPTLYVYRGQRPVPPELRHGPGVPEAAACLAIAAVLQVDGAGAVKLAQAVDARAVEPMMPVMKAFAMDVAPVWALFARASAGPHQARLDQLLTGAVSGSDPVLAAEQPDGTSHRLWRLDPGAAAELAEILSQLPIVVAQGGLQVEALRRLAAQSPGGRINGVPPAVLALLTPADAPPAAGQTPALLPVHRVLLASSGLDPDRLEQRLAPYFRLLDVPGSNGASGCSLEAVEAALGRLAAMRGEFNGFVVYLGRQRVRLARTKGRLLMESWSHPLGRSAWRAMDVNVLHVLAFERALGIPPDASRIHAPPLDVGWSIPEALQRVDAGDAVAAFLLAPPSPADLMAAALDNNPLPADSVRPWPPVPAGLVLRWRRP